MLQGVDEDGNAVTALVDEDGRIVMILSDTLDPWGGNIPMGLGELAACLGPAKRFDRRGQVIWLDGFEAGVFKWVALASGFGAAVDADPNYARTGGYSCKLTGGSDSGRSMSILRILPYPVLSRMGFECSWAFDSDLDRLSLAGKMFDGTNQHTPTVRYDYVNKKLQYLDENNAWVDIVISLDLYRPQYPFWTWKLVVDFENEKYARLLVNETAHDLSNIAYYKTASALTSQLQVEIYNYSTAGNNAIVYVDDVIITQKEPE